MNDRQGDVRRSTGGREAYSTMRIYGDTGSGHSERRQASADGLLLDWG